MNSFLLLENIQISGFVRLNLCEFFSSREAYGWIPINQSGISLFSSLKCLLPGISDGDCVEEPNPSALQEYRSSDCECDAGGGMFIF